MDRGTMPISQVDKRIASFQKKIRQLNSDRNAIVPVSRLPVEVLSEIFLFLAALIPYEEAKKRPGWIAISYVCQRWRAVAQGCHRLWTKVSFTHLCDDWVLEMLRRVQDAPLDITLRDHGSKHSTPIPLALLLASGGLAQVRTIDLVGCHFLNFVFQAFLGVSESVEDAPILQDLCLEAPSEHTHTMPSNFMLRSAPMLRRISLSNWLPESWNSPFFDGLVYLTIHATKAPPPPPLEFFKALERLATIAELDLDIKLPDMDKVAEGQRIIAFERMTSLRVGKRPMVEIVGLLKLLRIPHTSKLDIHCEFRTDDDLSIVQTFSTVLRVSCLSKGAHSDVSAHSTIKSLAIGQVYNLPTHCPTIRFSLEDPTIAGPSEISHCLQLYGAGKKDAFCCILEGLPLSELRSLDTIDMTLPLPWLRGQLVHLNTLTVTGREAYRNFITHADASTFPALKYLEISGVDFKHGSRRPVALDPADLTSFLKDRKDRGTKLEILVLKFSEVYKKDRSKFKGLCDEIEFWDE